MQAAVQCSLLAGAKPRHVEHTSVAKDLRTVVLYVAVVAPAYLWLAIEDLNCLCASHWELR